MARFHGVDEKDMTARQREVAERIIAGGRGHATGLMGLWLHQPDFADRAQEVGEYLRFKSTLPGNIRELIILTVARDWRCYHEWFVHEPIARRKRVERRGYRGNPPPDTPRLLMTTPKRRCRPMCVRCSRTAVCPTRSSHAIRERFGIPGIIEIAGIYRALRHRRGNSQRGRVRPSLRRFSALSDPWAKFSYSHLRTTASLPDVTRQVLRVLGEKEVLATFFMLGERLALPDGPSACRRRVGCGALDREPHMVAFDAVGPPATR